MKIVSLHWSQTIPIRHRVLWPDKPPEFCHIEGDENALHFGAILNEGTEDEFLASVASIYIDGESARLRKFATLPEFQGQGIGSALLAHIITTIKEKDVAHFWCDARATATGFYARFGLEEEGEIFTKSGLPYRKMSMNFSLGKNNMNDNLCPCGSGSEYQRCCQPFLLGQAKPATPEELMRSRYSAFYRGNIDYLIATRHPAKRKPDDRTKLAQSISETEWLGLRVLTSESIRDSRQRGFVEFVAFYREKHFSTEPGLAEQAVPAADTPDQLHEKSEFVWEAGQWYYVQGLTLPPIKITRNDPCWCGSGKKFKQCHARKQ